ncbi:MAG: bifunctional DNA-formamidopyrimidine glycosylase/DNA-(apurinic or apyrimidinic site) lyase [Acinetobacter sp.]|nr:bifunctional DNA-formamidopyrimidine glycosylase/DNA-(apurinic or apyrimidinic site) lyase [Acinetobacter sp.]
MPELPEVETTKLSLEPLLGATVCQTTVHQPSLRWRVPDDLEALVGYQLIRLQRRSKYIIATFQRDDATQQKQMLWHLGMSGSFSLAACEKALRKHDHVIFRFRYDDGELLELRYHDPRRFGCILWLDETSQKLLDVLGVEPLSDDFTADYLQQKFKNKSVAIKNAIMDSHIVVGVGNIYATESLFNLGIHPLQAAKTLTFPQLEQLVQEIKKILANAIHLGGTTLKDYSNAMGENGYFQQTLLAYGRAGEMCVNCETTLQNVKIAQRSSVFCPQCQPLRK